MIEEQFNSLVDSIKVKAGIDLYDLDELFQSSTAPTDIVTTYDGGLWQYTGKFVDMKWLVQGVEVFRPYIRGFLVLLLVFFHVRQALSIFGLSSGEIESAAKKGGKKE